MLEKQNQRPARGDEKQQKKNTHETKLIKSKTLRKEKDIRKGLLSNR